MQREQQMAQLVFTTHGSSGDLNPFLALGVGMQARGHTVRFALSPPLAALAEQAGFDVYPLAADAPLTAQEAVYAQGSSVGSLKAAVQQAILPTLRQKVDDLRAACDHADLLVAASLQLPASFVADETGIPWASVAVAPLALPSSQFSPSPLPFAPVPLRPLMNQIAWRVGAQLLRPIADPAVNALRADRGLQPRRDLLLTGNLSPDLIAVAVSPAFMPEPPDWPPHARTTGFCFWDTPGDWQAPPELSAFLEQPGPIVAVSSGSQSLDVRGAFAAFYRTSVEAVHQAGARALVLGAQPGTVAGSSADTLTLSYAPFSAIYPRCVAVIHHGGIGTTAQALRAGVPMLIAPWGFDQFFIGDRVAQLGAGQSISRRQYVTRRVAAHLRALIEDPSYRQRAEQLSAQIQREDGVGTLCEALEALLARKGLPSAV
ncbi:MAG TPA: glycosyltransferase, partial [Chloroflexaceae bacterium]|nr:glycosyltransferase [Chloroflexaceae bacterium]